MMGPGISAAPTGGAKKKEGLKKGGIGKVVGKAKAGTAIKNGGDWGAKKAMLNGIGKHLLDERQIRIITRGQQKEAN